MADKTKAELEALLKEATERADAAEKHASKLTTAGEGLANKLEEVNKQVSQDGVKPASLQPPQPSQPPQAQSVGAPPTPGRIGAHPAAAGPQGEHLKAITEIRWYRSDLEREHSTKRQGGHRWPHAAPMSVLVASIGNSWKGDSWARVQAMNDFAHRHGIAVTFREFQNRCFEPYDALGTMRNEVFASATGGGYEFCMMIDNDVRPEPDTLYRLLNRDLPFIAPYVEEPADPTTPGSAKRVLHGPHREPYQGIYPVKWHVLTMMLFKTAYIGALGDHFWGDAIGGDEGYHFQRSYAKTGVYPHVDSDIVLEAGGAPLYPLTVKKSGEWDKEGGVKQERAQRFDRIPERGPQFPGDRRVNQDGVWLPFNADAPMGAFPGDPTYPNIVQPPAEIQDGADVQSKQPVG